MISSINFSTKSFSNLSELIAANTLKTGKSISKSAFVSQLIEKEYDNNQNGIHEQPQPEEPETNDGEQDDDAHSQDK